MGDGLSLVSHLGANGDETSIIMLTTMDKDDQRIEGLRTGADDYLTKPFSFEEQLLSQVWGMKSDPESNLRNKLEPQLIHTVRGVGYVLDPERED